MGLHVQFSHYVIFFIAIFMVLQLILLGASTYPIKRRWDIAAYKSKDEVRREKTGREAACCNGGRRRALVFFPFIGACFCGAVEMVVRYFTAAAAVAAVAASENIFVTSRNCCVEQEYRGGPCR